jgi:hypothetical protein
MTLKIGSNYINQIINYSYFQKSIDHADGIVQDILQHVPGVINATSSAIGHVADRVFSVWGCGSSNQRDDSSNGAPNKRAGDKRCRSPSPITNAQANLPGKAASNGSLQAKTKKARAVPKAKRTLFPKISKCGPKAGCKGTLRSPQVDTSRSSNRLVDDGYDSDTRAE